jgi:hypothetical protein
VSERVDPELAHRMKSQLTIILGYCELLLIETADDDTRRPDLMEIQRAGRAVLDCITEATRPA